MDWIILSLAGFFGGMLNAVAVVMYAAGGAIDLGHLLPLGIMAVFGGYSGAAFAYHFSQGFMRRFIVLVGLFMSLAFFLRQDSLINKTYKQVGHEFAGNSRGE